MALSKILAGSPEEVPVIITGKHGLKYAGKELEFMSQVAKAAKSKSLEQFQFVVSANRYVLRTCHYFNL